MKSEFVLSSAIFFEDNSCSS